MPALLDRKPHSDTTTVPPTGPEQGVIEEARRRQRLRRIRIALGAAVVAAAVLIWAHGGGGSHVTPAHPAMADRAHAVDISDPHAASFNVRLVPMLTVGQVGWCIVVEENRITGGSACGGVPTPSRPLLQVYSWGEASSHRSTTVAVTGPQAFAVLVAGRRRVPTESLLTLPYGLRAARFVTSAKERSATLMALDGRGHPIAEPQTNLPRQATVHSWRYPSRPSRGACRLQAGGLRGLTARGGEVASAVRPFPGGLVGHAFLPCIATTYYLHRVPLRATVVLDAANPRARAAALPDWKPVRAAPGFFAEGGLIARRSGNAWLIVAQGSGLAQRVNLLRHLTPTIKP